ncbi:hypothetical protein PMIN02_009220 [Paraphaeosphaeria minitans]
MPTADHGLAMESAEAQHRDLDEPGASEKRETAVNPEPSPSVEEGEQVNHLHGSPLVLLIVSLTLAVAVISMDFTILATAIPRITSEFHSIEDVGWYGSVYLLSTNAFQPTFGKLYSMFNVKVVYLTAMAIFQIGSIVCATARSSAALIVGRAVAGVGASAIFSGGATIIGLSAPLRKRAVHLGVLSSMFGIASVIGPLLGGVFTGEATWRWYVDIFSEPPDAADHARRCFWINLPIGGVAMLIVFVVFKAPTRTPSSKTVWERLQDCDVIGTILILGTVVCLLLPLQWGGVSAPWSAPKVYGCLVAFGLLLLSFLAWQWRMGDRATVPLRIFQERTVCAASLVSGFLVMSMYAHVYYLPFYFQVIKGASPQSSGVRSIPYFSILAIASIGGGAVITVMRSYAEFMWAGSAILTVGSGLIHTLKVDSNPGVWIGYQIVAGLGVGLALQTPFIAVQRAVRPADMAQGMAVAIFFNSLGGALSISIAQNLFISSLRTNIPKYARGVDAQSIVDAGGVGIRDMVSADQLANVLHAYNLSITDAFAMSIAAAGCAFVASLFIKRLKL